MERDLEKTLATLKRGVVEIIEEGELRQKMEAAIKNNRPLRIKYGADPSKPDLHLGHTVSLRKLRQFQDLGHTVVFIIGDFTARIGDPSGQKEMRPRLSKEEVERNALTYEKQFSKILDRSRTEVVYNSSWCEKMNFGEVLELTSRFSVARILERDDFSKRYKGGKHISLLELLYPVIQGYDSVVVKADIEIGGTDQKFNLLVGRHLQKEYGLSPQTVLTFPLLEGLDGVEKMSKSLGNYIGIDESPKDIFGKIMSIPDQLIVKYFTLLTDVPLEEINKYKAGMEKGEINPKEVKMRLGAEILKLYHPGVRPREVAEEFNRIFRDKKLPSEIEEVSLKNSELKEGKIWAIKLLSRLGLVSTNSQARRLIEQGGVSINQEKIIDPEIEVAVKDGAIIRAGKKKFAKVKIFFDKDR
jgi:tyrosyl-tRNA synthetase